MRFFLITGFGLDKRAFSLLDLPEDKFKFFDLIPPLKGETLKTYALRMGREIGVGPDDVVGGVSFGGMMALEIAKAVKTRGVVIIASTTHPRHIRKRFLLFSHISPYVPDALVHRIFRLVPWVLKRQNMLTPEGQTLLNDIMTAFPPAWLRSMPPMIRKWEGCQPAAPFRRMHSEGDWLIRLDGDPKDLTVVKGKNHLITVSHPEAVRKFLLDTWEEFSKTQVLRGQNEK